MDDLMLDGVVVAKAPNTCILCFDANDVPFPLLLFRSIVIHFGVLAQEDRKYWVWDEERVKLVASTFRFLELDIYSM